MSTIRKQSLFSSAIVYFGFLLGFVNTYLFTREGGLTKEQYGLTMTFLSVASIFFTLASFGTLSYITKFFPYYNAHLPRRQNDQFTWALLFPLLGFVVVAIIGAVFKEPVVNKVFNNAPELPKYYYWIYPFAFGYTIYAVLEGFSWFHGKSVLSNFFKEVLFRLFTMLLIVLTTLGVIRSFDRFIHIYSLLYLLIGLLLLLVLWRMDVVHFTFRVSKVSRRLKSKILALTTFTWSSTIIFNLVSVVDKLIIAAVLPDGMAMAGIYSLGEILASLIQAPQRAIVSAAVSHLSEGWRAKDLGRIGRIYQRSSINQLVFSVAMFCLIWLNFRDALLTFHIQKDFNYAFLVFFFLGLTRVLDMGTGLSSQIIATSTSWRFEFTSGLILFTLALPLNYLLTRKVGIYGPAVSGLVAFTVFNAVRYIFLWRRYGMQPFTINTLYTLLLAAACYLLAYFAGRDHTGFWWLVLRTTIFSVTFATGVLALKLSPDIMPVWETIKKRLGLGSKE
ncbi:lipopolysaccharide biosynthesis protein [Flaviaesturariibacter flavus]|uniref:Lipopolysaccharide biosynthesis protein n=1 Tax=Flaviaesturariibacter flavus TaxID=2502780 RepID=A0A4R1B8S0_9BACT|nr:polysaccharide biosynthesis C-terminal domain-containing protein [Flaviaesturariibacter flavus]TCJ12559.1 lipopolysaccharide biosynthesis protein [Flaviaesturariibacter flavus]